MTATTTNSSRTKLVNISPEYSHNIKKLITIKKIFPSNFPWPSYFATFFFNFLWHSFSIVWFSFHVFNGLSMVLAAQTKPNFDPLASCEELRV